ncbi:MAG: hypothetical protein Q9160_002308 [Pyrenula sp. 1 TL-2023]
MAGRYSVEELLYLKNSPLVSKPDSLPPKEEWMGPIPDPTQRKIVPPRARPDDPHSGDHFGKRPGLFDTHHTTRKSATGQYLEMLSFRGADHLEAPEDLVLGPPKTTFSSSSNARNFGRSPQPKDTIDDAIRAGERHNTQERFRRNGDIEEHDGEKRDSRFTAFGGRRGPREDRDSWDTNRQRRHVDGEDRERKPRRNGGERWDSREHKGPPGLDSDKRPRKDDEERHSARHDGERRSRFQQPWFKGDSSRDMTEEGVRRPSHWRKDNASGGYKAEQGLNVEEPEWLDSNETAKPQQAHTQEDFQRWKEQMKAGVQQSGNETIEGPQTELAEKKADLSDGNFFDYPASTQATDSSLDSFFGMFTTTSKTNPPLSAGLSNPKEKPNSRFKSLFSPAAIAPETIHNPEPIPTSLGPDVDAPPQPTSPLPASESADQEGFQRILQMLGGRSRNVTPQDVGQDRSRMNTYVGSRPLSTGLNPQSADTIQITTANEPRSRNSGGLESLLPLTSPARASDSARKSSNSRDTEMLLRLMKEASVNDQNAKLEMAENGRNFGGALPPTSDEQSQMQGFRDAPRPRNMSAGFPDSLGESANTDARRSLHSTETLNQLSGLGPQRTHFDEAILNRLAMNQNTNMRVNVPPAGPPSLPPGVARLSAGSGNPTMQQYPPGWPNQHTLQQPTPQQPPPNAPPGIPNPPNSGPNPSFPPMIQNMNAPQPSPVERSRKYTGGLGGTRPPYTQPGPPPGMGYPPGFANNGNSANTIPPGFGQMSRSPVDNPIFAGRGHSGGQGPMMPHGSANLMDIFASGPDGRSGGRGGNWGPGGYR